MESDNSYEDGDDEIFYPIVDLHEGRNNEKNYGEENINIVLNNQNGDHNLETVVKKSKKSKNKTLSHRKMARRKMKINIRDISTLKSSTNNQIDCSVIENGFVNDNSVQSNDDDDNDDDNSPLKMYKKKKKRKKKKEKSSKSRLKMKSAIYPDNNCSSPQKENGDHQNMNSEEVTVKRESELTNSFEFCTLVMKNVEEIKEEVVSDHSDQDEYSMKVVDETYHKSDEESEDDVPLSKLENKTLPIETQQPKPLTKRMSQQSSDEDSTWGVKKVKKGKQLKVKKLKLKIKKENISLDESNEVKPSCEECNKSFKSLSKYNIHLRKVHRKPYTCSLCPKTFHKQSKLEDHFNSHTGERPYSCYLCEGGASFRSEASLKSHVKVFHSGNANERKQFPCTLCTKVLSSYTCLEEHIRLHTGEKPIACKLCGKHFTRERDMRQHLNLHKEMWKCDQCDRCFLTPFKLKEHYRSHTGETPYECDKCERKFSRVADFRYHIGTHLGLKPYGCELCGMRFTTSSSVTRHRLNMHQSGPKHYECHICTKKFHTESRLKTHVKNHENSKRFRCDLCPAARGSLSELNKHALIHGGEFRCDTCHKGCSTAERLATHVARHDLAGKPYACFVCSLGYRSSQSLNKHLSTVHKNEDIPKITPQHLCMLCGQVFEHKDKLNRHLKDSHIVIVVGEIQAIEEPEPDVIEDKSAIKKDTEIEEETTVPIISAESKPAQEEIEKVDYEVAIERDVELRLDNPIKIPKVAPVIHERLVIVVPETVKSVLKEYPVVVNSIGIEKGVLKSPTRTDELVDGKTSVSHNDTERGLERTASDNSSSSDYSKSQESSVLKVSEKVNDLQNDGSTSVRNDSPVPAIELKPFSSVRSVQSINASTMPINVPIVPHGLLDSNFGVRDLSASSQLSSDVKSLKVSASRTFESPYMRIPYSEPVIQQNRIIPPSYRSVEDTIRQNFDNYPQMPNAADHLSNPWFLAAKSNQMQRQIVPRNLIEASKQRYSDLRMPRLEVEQPDQFRNFNHRLTSINQRQDAVLHSDRKYYYETDLQLNNDRKNAYAEAALHHQRQMNLEDVSRRKFPHIQQSQPMIQELPSPRQTIRDYQGQQNALQGREYTNHSPSLSVRDLSNASNTASAETHYNHHSFAAMAASPHNFFRDFRDLQHRMLGAAGVQDYGSHNHHHASLASRHIAQLSGMDMTNQRLVNPGSPLSPYNQSSPHMTLDNLSPMSRNSYEDIGGSQQQQHASSSNPSYQPTGQIGGIVRNLPTQGIDGNNKDPGNEQMGSSVPYETRVAAN